MRVPGARADGHLVTFVELFQQPLDVVRVVLSVGIHAHEDVAACVPGAGLDRGAVTH